MRQCPGVGTRYFTVPVVARPPVGKEFQQLDLGRKFQGFARCAIRICRHNWPFAITGPALRPVLGRLTIAKVPELFFSAGLLPLVYGLVDLLGQSFTSGPHYNYG